MEAMKCDRCGAYYDKRYVTSGIEFTRIKLCNDGYFEKYDMCPECMNNLKSFMKDGKKNDESRRLSQPLSQDKEP